MTPQERSDLACRLAIEAGFDLAGVAPAGPVGRLDYIEDWLGRGLHGEMEYLRRHHRLRADSRSLLEGARSIIVVADNYRQDPPTLPAAHNQRLAPEEKRPTRRSAATDAHSSPITHYSALGRVARYAWGRDYHKVIRRKLRRFVDALRRAIDEPFDARICVDTAPLIEREAAAAAGLGWIGKNTMVLHPELGSFFFLGEVITTLELAPSTPVPDHCGSCTRCLEACPTGALVEPYRMDATRCISYLTIEHRGAIADELRPKMGAWVYGCDVCQEVCPHNRRAHPATEPDYRLMAGHPLVPLAPLAELLKWSQQNHDEALAGSAMRRATLAMLKRSAGIAVENAKQ